MKKIALTALIGFLAPLHSAEILSYRYNSAQEDVTLALCGLAAGFIITHALSSLYFDYFWPVQKLISHAHSSFSAISTAVENSQVRYNLTDQLSNWELKQIIYAQKEEKYPFKTYHDNLQETIDELIFYKYKLKKTVYRLDYRYKNAKNQDMATQRELKMLNEHGKVLLQSLKRTITTLSALKKRVASFYEYDTDISYYSTDQAYEKSLN